MQEYVSPNSPELIGRDDSESIQNAVDFAVEAGINKVVIPCLNCRTGKPVWIISRAILLPSDITVVLSNCCLRLEDGVYCNIFRNKNMYTALSLSEQGEQTNIHIIGEGYAVLDGGKTNYLFEANLSEELLLNKELIASQHENEGMRINNLIIFHNVKNFSIENIEVKDQRWWAINLIYCSFGRVSDIVSRARNNIPNQDCIDIRRGCNNVTIERITGQSGDDLVAITALDCSDRYFGVENKTPDVHDIVIRDILGTSVRQGIVVLRNQDDVKLYNVHIENVIQSNLDDKNNLPYVTLRIGENGYYRKHQSEMGSTKNITVRNVISASDTVVMVGATLENVEFTNIQVIGSRWAFLSYGVKMKNVRINGFTYCLPYMKAESPAGGFLETNHFAFNGWMRADDYIENMQIFGLSSEFENEKIRLDENVKNEIFLDGVKL